MSQETLYVVVKKSKVWHKEARIDRVVKAEPALQTGEVMFTLVIKIPEDIFAPKITTVVVAEINIKRPTATAV